jgi:hypothetical protein
LSGFKKDTTKAFAASAYECIDLSNFSSIKEKAFMENPILTTEARNIKITFENNTSGLSIDMGAFAACAKIETVVLPKSGSLSIGDFAFTQCTGLKNVLFPIDSNVTLSLFGASAFFRCESIEKIDLSSTSFAGTIAKRAFSQCKNLKEILLPGGTFSIGINVFEECTNLETITPSTSKTTIIDSIADGTFEGCPSLTVSGIEKLKNSINKSNLAYVENKSGNNIVGAAIVAAIGKT